MSTQRTTHCLRPHWTTACALVALTLTPLSYSYAPLNTDDAGTVGHKTNQIELFGSFAKSTVQRTTAAPKTASSQSPITLSV